MSHSQGALFLPIRVQEEVALQTKVGDILGQDPTSLYLTSNRKKDRRQKIFFFLIKPKAAMTSFVTLDTQHFSIP
jgi:hypothetical protein